jgi:membrane protease YdiL (CAAX protease family)
MEYISTIFSISMALIIIVTWTLLTIRLVKSIGIDIRDVEQRTGARFLVIAIIANILLIGVIGLVFKVVDGHAFSSLGFQLSARGFSYAMGMLVTTFVIALIFVFGLQARTSLSVHWLLDIKRLLSLSFLLAVLALFVAALQEEVVFRGFLAANLGRYGFAWALLGSTVIFTGFHFLTSKVNAFQVTDWFLGGLSLFVIYIVSGSIWVSTIVHFSRNLVNMLVLDIADTHVLLRLKPSVKPEPKTIYTFILTMTWLAGITAFYSLRLA